MFTWAMCEGAPGGAGDVSFGPLAADELTAAALQLGESYRAAYRGLMEDAYLDSLADDHWVPVLQGSLAEGGICLVAAAAGRIVGTAVFRPAGGGAKAGCAELHALYLSPGFAGRGVGAGPYAAAQRAMRQQGYSCCTLEVLTENLPAVRFYEWQGFARTRAFTVAENGMTLHCGAMRKAL